MSSYDQEDKVLERTSGEVDEAATLELTDLQLAHVGGGSGVVIIN